MAGLKTIIALSFILAIGFLLVILSCALFKVYYPLLVVATYVAAPLPDFVCARLGGSSDDFIGGDSGGGGAIKDFGRFFTGFLVVMGI
ncbi:MAG: Vacuolar protein sorting-associated protein 55, partial [Chrysothrix sp. TS-e1954]